MWTKTSSARILSPNKAIFKLNKYSVSPAGLEKWLTNLHDAIEILGSVDSRNKNLNKEQTQLSVFKRGVYLKKNIKSKKTIKKSDLYFAFPAIKNQLTANDLQILNNYTKQFS